MAWWQIGDKPLTELMKTQLTDAYMRHQATMRFRACSSNDISVVDPLTSFIKESDHLTTQTDEERFSVSIQRNYFQKHIW